MKRLAERKGAPPSPQEPPRLARVEPDAGPVGSTTGLPVGYAAWYRSAVHSQTFPCISKKPHGLAENCPTFTVWLGSAPWFQFAFELAIVGPHEYAVVVPAREAYSHCDSVGKT